MSGNGIGGGLEGAEEFFSKYGPPVVAVIVVGVLGIAGLSRVGCVNRHTPPGHEGYIRSTPIAGAAEFIGTQRGPTSTGWVWRQQVVNIDMRPRTYSEAMSIMTKGQLELSFRAHARIQLRPGGVKKVVEDFGGPDWFEKNVRYQFRAAVRAEVQKLRPFEVKSQSGEISSRVMEAMGERYGEDTAVEFLTVDIGDIQYPDVVVQSVIRKFETNQQNEQKQIELKIAQKQIEIGVAEARGIADAQRIIRTTLDPMFLQYEALEAIETLASTENTTFMVMPYSKDGNAPVIMNMGN